MFGRSKAKGNYAYVATKAKALQSLLIKEDDYNKMLQLSTPELCHFTAEAGYSREITELGDVMQGVDLVEHATYAYMARTIKVLLDSSQGELKTLLAAYLQKWDNWNFKVVMRGKSYGLPADEIRKELVPAGSMSAEDLEKAIALESCEEIISMYSKDLSIEIPAELINQYKVDGNLGKIEDFIDKMQYVRLLKVIPTNSIPTRMFSDYIRTEVDIRNLETILKLKVEGLTGDAVMDYVIPGGKQIDGKFAKQLADAERIQDTFSDLAQLDFYEFIKDIVEKGDNVTVRELILGTKRYEIAEAKKFSQQYPLSILPVVYYMICMENEARNIRTIARGIESGLSKEDIKQLLVI